MKPLKSKVSITLDSDVIEEIKRLAEEDNRSFSQYINMVLKQYLKKITNKIRSIFFLCFLFYSVLLIFGMLQAYTLQNHF